MKHLLCFAGGFALGYFAYGTLSGLPIFSTVYTQALTAGAPASS